MRKSAAAYFIAFLLFSIQSIAQSKMTIENVLAARAGNMGTIIENEQVKGYYLFFQSDKVDKNNNEYTLRMLDENCKLLKDAVFTDSKKLYLLESGYNGNSLMFLFFNDEDNSLSYRVYGMDGKQTITYTKPLDKKSEAYFKAAYHINQKEESENKSLFDIPNRGFVSVVPVRESKKYTYEVTFYGTSKRKTWTFDPIETGKFATASYLGANDSIAVLEVLSKDKLSSSNMESTLIGLNLETGKKAFEVRTQDGRHKLYPMGISTLQGNNSEFLLMGTYYNGDDKIAKDKTEGLGIWKMNNQGKIMKSKYITWANDLMKFAKVDQKGKLADIGYLYFHKILQTQDGRIFAIGEGYKKVADGLGIAASILTQSNQGVTKMIVTDLVMLQLSPNFDLENARIFDKNKNSFHTGPYYDFASPHLLAVLLKVNQMFDYRFSQMAEGKSSFVTGYTDYERSKDYKGMTFHAISYYDGKLSEDKINLKSDASSSQVLPAKPGFVMLWEYYKKKKKVEVRLEKIN